MLPAWGALAITLGLLVLALAALRRLQRGLGGGALPLRVVQRAALGPKHGVALVRCGARVLVVGQAEGGLSLLGELEGDDLRAALDASERGAVPALPSAAARPVPAWVARLTGAAGLVLLAATALP
ncbi:MAG: flagellar biosynthetic protein FliO, partial [Gemmatimonadales bacterium]|nr:flagellar biosynthetic protein FliO [Gemmatimonadales bacterium]